MEQERIIINERENVEATDDDLDKLSKDKKKKIVARTLKLQPKIILNNATRILQTQNILIYRQSLVINENIIKGLQTEDLFIKSLFYYKKIDKIIINEDYLKICLGNLDVFPTNFNYMIKRFQSYGDSNYHHLANTLQQIQQVMDDCSKFANQNPDYFENLQNNQLIESYKGKKYIMYQSSYQNNSFSHKSIIVSKALIKMLGCTPQELAARFMKLKSLQKLQLINHSVYHYFMINYVQTICEFKKAMINRKSIQCRNQISKRAENSAITEMYSLNHQPIRVQMMGHVPNQCLGILQIERVDDLEGFPLKRSNQSIFTSEEQNRLKKIKENESSTILKISRLASNNLKQNEKKVCTYRQIQNQQQE